MASLTFYVDGVSGADTNGGSSEGAAIASGTSGSTNSTTTVDLSGDTPDLSGVSAGDSIRLSAETTGRGSGGTQDIYEITAVDDGLDTVTVTPTPGTNSGQTWAIGGAWATVQKAVNMTDDGDHVYVKASGDYVEKVTLSQAGTSTAMTHVEGYTTTPGDNGKATIDGTGNTNALDTANHNYWRWSNIIFENGTSSSVLGLTADYHIFYNCEANSSGSHGFGMNNQCYYINCSSSSAANQAFFLDNNCVCFGCTATGAGNNGFFVNLLATISNCIAASCADVGIMLDGAAGTVINCTIDGDAKDTTTGIEAQLAVPATVINNIIYDCATGLNRAVAGATPGELDFTNQLNSNTSNYGGNWTGGSTNITSAPAFTDEASGDYTLTAGSAARNAGTDASGHSSPGMDIGAHQSADSGGGVIKLAGDGGGLVG